MKIRAQGTIPGFGPALRLLLLIGLSLTVSDLVAQQNDQQSHTVRSGETLFSIARQYDITVTDLREWNQLESDGLQVGMTLRTTPPASRDAVRHTVAPGETLFSISRSYGVTIAEIQQWNNLGNTVISPGQELLIHADDGATARPQPAPEPVVTTDERRESIVAPVQPDRASTYYTVRSGDYLNRIANEHGMTTQELRELNNLQDDVIRVGQRLAVRQVRSTPVVDEDADDSTPQGRFVRYRVRQGESLSGILNRYLMTTDELQALNPGLDIQSLSTGQQITVLLPPSRNFSNPYLLDGGLRNLGEIQVTRYSTDHTATPTTSGELYNPNQLTAAHANMALGSVVYVQNPSNDRSLYVKVNDRIAGSGIRLSARAFELLGFQEGATATAVIYQDE